MLRHSSSCRDSRRAVVVDAAGWYGSAHSSHLSRFEQYVTRELAHDKLRIILALSFRTADDLNSNVNGSLATGETSIPCAGVNSILPKEHGTLHWHSSCASVVNGSCVTGSQFFSLPIIRPLDSSQCVAVGAVAAWDSSLHDSPALNRATATHERVHVIVKASIRLSHPAVMDVVLRKRLTLNVYKKQSLTERLKRKLIGVSGDLTASGVTYEVVSSIPKASEDIEDRETLALAAASELTGDNGQEDAENQTSFIEKYTR